MVRASAPPTDSVLPTIDAHAAAMDRASPGLIEARQLLRRRDWKFLVHPARVPEILALMASTHAVLQAGDSRVARYRTLYFDTADLRCFHDHRRGRARRTKVRVRDYVEREQTLLEVKRRTVSGATDKVRMARPWGHRALDAEAQAFVAEHAALPVDRLEPVLGNRFRRVGLLALHARERVTIDLDLRVDLGASSVALEGLAIVEIKSAEPRYRTPTLEVMRRLGLRPGSFSKYCVGTSLLRSVGIQSFAPVLRRMGRVQAGS